MNWKSNILVITGFIVAALAWSTMASSTDDAKSTIQKVERERIQAMLDRNIEAIDKIMAPDCIHITSSGKIRTKQEFLNMFSKSKGGFKTFDIHESQVRIYDDIAVVTGIYSNSSIINGQTTPLKHAVFTRIYKLGDTNWQLISHQATEQKGS